jgi:hypothetical protein
MEAPTCLMCHCMLHIEVEGYASEQNRTPATLMPRCKGRGSRLHPSLFLCQTKNSTKQHTSGLAILLLPASLALEWLNIAILLHLPTSKPNMVPIKATNRKIQLPLGLISTFARQSPRPTAQSVISPHVDQTSLLVISWVAHRLESERRPTHRRTLA